MTAPGEHRITGAVQGQHLCDLERVDHCHNLHSFSFTLVE